MTGDRAEAEGLEPPRVLTRLISNQLPYQLDYASSELLAPPVQRKNILEGVQTFKRASGQFSCSGVRSAYSLVDR